MRTPIFGLMKRLVLLCWLGSGFGFAHAIGKPVGKVSFAQGGCAAQQQGGAPRILGKDADIYQGDNIQTTDRSFVIITFSDGAKVTVRPNSSFSVDQYGQQNTQAQAAQMTLYQGGVQATTGEIAKQAPDNFQIKTPLATVKSQGASYSVRLCGKEDCQEENDMAKIAQDASQANIAARVVDIKGQVFAKNQYSQDAKERPLSLGAPLYSSDSIRSQENSYALMVFHDGEKITLQPSSQMLIADYSHQRPGQPDRAIYRLTVGGMRALTGSIGKTNKDAYKIDTPVGTIGIRGTGFDLVCVGSCINLCPTIPINGVGSQAWQGQTLNPCPTTAGINPTHPQNGLYSHVWQGQIVVINGYGEQLLTVPESGYLATPQAALSKLPEFPASLISGMVPRPDTDHSDLERLFSPHPHPQQHSQHGIPPGLYVAVHEGMAHLAKANLQSGEPPLDLVKNEGFYVSPQKEASELTTPQAFLADDLYLPESGWPGQDNTNAGGITANGCGY